MPIGAELAQARTAAGKTVAQMSASTRIRQTILTGIEDDDFSVCKGNSYARGHIRVYAQALGLDPDPLVAEYDASHPSTDAPVDRPVLPLPESPVPVRRGRGVLLAMGAGVVVLVLAWAVNNNPPAPAAPLTPATTSATTPVTVEAPAPADPSVLPGG